MQSTSGCARASSSSIFLSVTDTSRRPIYLGGLSISTVSHAREMHRPSQLTTFTAHDLHSARPSQRTTFTAHDLPQLTTFGGGLAAED